MNRAEKLQAISKLIRMNEDSKQKNYREFHKYYLIDKIDDLHRFHDTILQNYYDAIEYMNETQFTEFMNFQTEKYNKINNPKP